jgi:prolipoprotein diacylglyceryltransferase
LPYFVWNVDPEIFQLGPFAPRWYGVCLTLGFFLGYMIMVQIYRNERRPEEHLSSLFLYIFLGTMLGAESDMCCFINPTTIWHVLGKSC